MEEVWQSEMETYLTMTMRPHLGAVIVRPMVVVSGRYDLASLHHDCAQREAHRTLRRCLGALGEIVLSLVHGVRNVSNRGTLMGTMSVSTSTVGETQSVELPMSMDDG